MSVIVKKDECIGCESCLSNCPSGAIIMKDGKAEITDACTTCGACVESCPVGAIELNLGIVCDNRMSLELYKNVMVYMETNQGKIQNVSLELLGQGRILADKLGEELVAAVIGHNMDEVAKTAIINGADKVYVVDQPELAQYNAEAYAHALKSLSEKHKPNAILIGATHQGRAMGPRVGAGLKTGLCADCTNLDAEGGESKLILWTRPAFGGNIMATIICPEHRPQMGTVRPNVFKKPEPNPAKVGEIIPEKFEFPEKLFRVKTLDACAGACAGVNLEEAEVIVSGGRGLGSVENYEMVKELADLLGATYTGSRAIVEEGWIDHQRQVGQSGKTVGPKIYIACGISGAIQHVAGMSSSDYIIAINKDPNAPIFKSCDFGIVGDVKEVLPALIAQVKAMKQ